VCNDNKRHNVKQTYNVSTHRTIVRTYKRNRNITLSVFSFAGSGVIYATTDNAGPPMSVCSYVKNASKI